jgi:Effector Associated Constant Component 1
VNDQRATLRLDIQAEPDADAQELADLTAHLHEELLQLDVDAVEPAREGEPPPGAKAMDVLGLGTLLVTLVKSAGDLRSLIATLRGWLSGQPRTVRIELDGDVLEMTGISSQAEEQLIADWIARHAKA